MNDRRMKELAELLLGRKVQLTEETDREYLSDRERRDLVAEFRRAEKAGDYRKSQQVIEQLFKEFELMIYKLANNLSSGGRSRRSGSEDFGSAHNDAEELKTIGTMAFIKAISGDEEKGTGFDPEGPGTFMGFMRKYVEGAMKNAHAYEKRHFGLEKTSLDAPHGGDEGEDDSNLYNVVFDKGISDSDYEEFLLSDAYQELDALMHDMLNDREIDIVKDYFGVEGRQKLTPTQLGQKHGVSKQRIDLIVKKVKNKLRDALSSEVEV